jgi:site-specific recombinase XerD
VNKDNLKEIVSLMLSELSGVSRASLNTLNAYQNDLNDFCNFCQDFNILSINTITEKHVRRYIMKLNDEKLSRSSISRKLSSLRRLFNFALRNDIINKNPLKKIPNPKIKRKLPETINLDSFLEIIRLMDDETDKNVAIRNKAIFELLYGCALRVSELCSLDFQDVDLKKMNVKVLGKGSKVRIVPIGEKSLSIINEYITNTSKSVKTPLFVKEDGSRIDRFLVYKIVNKYLNKVTDLDKKSPHILRHSAATHMLDREADLIAVKEILGHENLSTTQIYTHVSVERLKKSYKKAHPKS